VVPASGQAGLEKPFDDEPVEGADADDDGDLADDADGVRDADGVADPEADDGDVVLADVLRDGDMEIVET
jgi:hypothetical protein